jgi:hypothetical protein
MLPIPCQGALGKSVADSEHPCQTQRSDGKKSKNARSFASEPTIKTRQSPGRSASAWSMLAAISDRTTGTQPVCCISTTTAIPPKISPRVPLPQTMRRPCEDSAAPSPKAEYDRGLWRYRLLSPLRLENAETPIGGVPFRPVPLSLLNSNCSSRNCSSRHGCIFFRLSSAPGASKTGIGSMFQNGYWRSGALP